MDLRTKREIWARSKYKSLDESTTVMDVERVLIYINGDYPNTIHGIAARLSLDLLSDDGTNDDIERTFNGWQLLETAQNNNIKTDKMDKLCFMHHLRQRTFSYNEMLNT